MGKVLVIVLLVLLAWPAHVRAIMAGCLPGGFPSTPGPDAVGRTFAVLDELFRGDVWRVTCADDPNQIAILFRVVPQGSGSTPLVCSSSFVIVQGGQQIVPVLRETASSSSFCNDLLVATTLALERQGGPAFDPRGAFTLAHDSDIALAVPAGGGTPQPSLAIVATGCSACRPGDVVSFTAHVSNPGPDLTAELKGGARFPDNQGTLSFLGGQTTVFVPAGHEANFPLFTGIIPGGIPGGVYTIEAALLEPNLGVTIIRNGLGRSLTP